MSNLELKKTISHLKESFQTIDFRAAYYFYEGQWEYIVSSLRFTNNTKEELSLIQKKLDAEFQTHSFKIKFRSLDIQEFKGFWKEICESAKRSVKEITNDMVKSVINYVGGRRTSNYLLDRDKEYNTIQFTIEFSKLNKLHHERFQFIRKELIDKGRKEIYPIIEKALQIQNFSLNSPLYSIVLLPIYVKINDLIFINNYLSGDVIFHRFYKDWKLHFLLSSVREKSNEHKEFLLSTDREKIKWFDYDDLSNHLFKIRFTVHYEKIKINSLTEFYKICCRLSSPDFDNFLIDFEVQLKEVFQNIKYIELIPDSLMTIIDPLLKINTLDRLASKNQSKEIIGRMINIQIEELKNIFLKNIDWLMSNENVRMMRDFFFSAANRRDTYYNNDFADLVVTASDKIIKSEIIEDIDIKSRFNDLLIKYNYNLTYQSKLYYYGKRLAELREEILLLLDEIFEKYPQIIEHSEFDGRGRISLDFPKFWSEVKIDIPDSNLTCELFFFRNNSSLFNFHIIHILFYHLSRPERIWSDITPKQKEMFIQFLNKISDIKDLEIIGYELPENLISKLNKKIDTDKISKSELFIKKKKKFKIIGIEGETDKFIFSDLNIFIGKNNRGKTVSLTTNFIKISDNQKVYNNQKAVYEFHQKYPQFSTYELYYIPHNREIDNPLGRKQDLKEGLIDVLNNLRKLITKDYLKVEPIDIEDRNNEVHSNSWKIPNFLEIIDIFSIDLEDTDDLIREDINIIDKGKALLTKFNQIWESWKVKVELFFEDIEVKTIKVLGRGGRHKMLFYDKWRQREISNWKSFGSGTQQLLNLIFIIEFIKICPSIVYGRLIEEINNGNIKTAFDEYVKEIHTNRIIFLDEPEVSLHPNLQRKFFNYLNESSRILQIFIATQSPFFLDINNFNDLLGNTINVTMCKKEETGEFVKQKITKENKILVIDEIFDYNHLETAFYLSKNSYEDLMITDDKRNFQLLTLKMIDKLISDRKKYDPDYSKLLNLGTYDEENNSRLIQNAIFLSIEPTIINLNNKSDILNECQKIFLYQIHINEFKSINEKMRFKATCASNWNKKTCLNFNVLSYTEEQSKVLSKKIMRKLNNLENKGKEILKHSSIILFPENTLPYQILDSLINYSKEKNIIIIGGMEHIKLSRLKDYFDEFVKKYPHDFKRPIDFNNINSIPKFVDNSFVNQAIVINSNGKFSFQIKNIPVSKLGKRVEGIPLIPNLKFSRFITSVGNLSVFICKDFLVNYEVIDKWMSKNKVTTLLVPSFTKLVNPFIYKFGNIIRNRYNEGKTIAFVNIAEYGGSGIFNVSYERQYEPGKESLFKDREEECKPFIMELPRELRNRNDMN
ncbi:hypothetical protein LCGC14_0867500 [marine sediment metagenome]|uniref:Endonuclease GajA/Old nuclease/RecF-like AAA domain-containing protein n=1 Tax=marine sediment metagenome TaxID=412755 RepID=A0A0F9PRA6_9ZZZZ